jgi:tRNA threonylcarbamoyl adenosine modification protein YeaZ
MHILAFDTTQEHGGVGVFRDSECLAVAPHDGTRDYSKTLFRELDEALGKAGIRLEDIDLYAVANGPGSFTGIRVGIAAALGWRSVFHRPVRGVTLFDAMIEEAQPQTPISLTLLDAGRGEVYGALYSRLPSHASSRQSGEGSVFNSCELADFVDAELNGSEGITCITLEEDGVARSFQTALPAFCRWQLLKSFLVPAIARVAVRSFKEEGSQRELDAYYIRRPDAELHS